MPNRSRWLGMTRKSLITQPDRSNGPGAATAPARPDPRPVTSRSGRRPARAGWLGVTLLLELCHELSGRDNGDAPEGTEFLHGLIAGHDQVGPPGCRCFQQRRAENQGHLAGQHRIDHRPQPNPTQACWCPRRSASGAALGRLDRLVYDRRIEPCLGHLRPGCHLRRAGPADQVHARCRFSDL